MQIVGYRNTNIFKYDRTNWSQRLNLPSSFRCLTEACCYVSAARVLFCQLAPTVSPTPSPTDVNFLGIPQVLVLLVSHPLWPLPA